MSWEPTAPLAEQIEAVRRRVGLIDYAAGDATAPVLLQSPADAALEALESVVATSLDLREASFRQALALDEQGRPALDLLLGIFRGQMWIFAQGGSADEVRARLGLPDAVDLTEEHALISVDGPFAWEVLGRWDTPTAIGLPYLGIYSPTQGVHVVRAGQTGEYGYLLVVQQDQAQAVKAGLEAACEGLEPVFVGTGALRHCSLENWIFDIGREGAHDLDALELQLTWRLDLEKQATGLDAIRAHRDAGLRRRLTALTTAQPVQVGDPVHVDGTEIGRVLGVAPRLDFGEGHSVLAVLDLPWAHPGLACEIGGQPAQTRSAPFLLNRSLFLNPQRHGWANRDEVELPPEILWPDTTSW